MGEALNPNELKAVIAIVQVKNIIANELCCVTLNEGYYFSNGIQYYDQYGCIYS
jgi:hypothetical protein